MIFAKIVYQRIAEIVGCRIKSRMWNVVSIELSENNVSR
jgi:hypothetical protein